MARRLTLICHGATAATRAGAFSDDEPLEAKALAAARALSDHGGRVDRALVSPALRARQTAHAMGLVAVEDAELRDWDVGTWRGRSLAMLQAEAPDALAAWRSDPSAAPHGGESLTRLLARVAEWLGHVDTAAGHVVAVTHAAVVRAVVLAALEAPAAAFWHLDVVPLSRTDLRTDGRRWTLRTFGYASAI